MPENNSEFSRRSFLTSAALGSSAQAAQTGESRPQREHLRLGRTSFLSSPTTCGSMARVTGHPFARTPHLDRIAREGVTFDNFFCVTPLCSPSRASFLTGLYAHAHRIINNDKEGYLKSATRCRPIPVFSTNPDMKPPLSASGTWAATIRGGRDSNTGKLRAQGQYVNPVVNVEGERRRLVAT